MGVQLPSDSLARLGKVLGEGKTAFLDDLERSIYSYIVGTGRQCIAIVQKIPKKGSTEADSPAFRYYSYKLNMDDLGDFVKVLFKFMTKKKHEGYELDSALTAPILEIIEQKFVALYEAHGQEISEELLQAFRKDKILLQSFVGRLSDVVSSKMSEKAQEEIVNLLAHQTHDAVTSSTAHVIGHQIAHFSTTAVGSQVTLMAANVLAHTLAVNIGHVLAKVMASAAFKKVLFALIHKKVVGVIINAVLKFLAATFGASVGAGILPSTIPDHGCGYLCAGEGVSIQAGAGSVEVSKGSLGFAVRGHEQGDPEGHIPEDLPRERSIGGGRCK